jgi:class 3 adenylate cyclase
VAFWSVRLASAWMRSLGLVATQTFTFLFADMEGSTAMAQRLVDGYARVLAGHHQLIRAALAADGGEEVVAQGDEAFAVLALPRACADAAIPLQRALVSHAWPAGKRARVRMGIQRGLRLLGVSCALVSERMGL